MTQDTTHTTQPSEQREPRPINTRENLMRALDEAGVKYKLDENGDVIASTEVVAYLESKEAINTGDSPVVKTKEELENPHANLTDEEKGYSLEILTDDEVKERVDAGQIEIGGSDLEAKSDRHRNVEIYVGPIPELHGKGCLVKRDPAQPKGVAVQFDDDTLVLNDRALGYGWHDFPADHISDARPFIDKWRDIPSAMRQVFRKARGIPRIHPTKHAFQTPKQMRRGTPGAFGGVTARAKRLQKLATAALKNFLVNVECEDPEHSKSIAVSAPSEFDAIMEARTSHESAFPDATIKSVTTH